MVYIAVGGVYSPSWKKAAAETGPFLNILFVYNSHNSVLLNLFGGGHAWGTVNSPSPLETPMRLWFWEIRIPILVDPTGDGLHSWGQVIFDAFLPCILLPRSLLPRKEWADINASWMTNDGSDGGKAKCWWKTSQFSAVDSFDPTGFIWMLFFGGSGRMKHQ